MSKKTKKCPTLEITLKCTTARLDGYDDLPLKYRKGLKKALSYQSPGYKHSKKYNTFIFVRDPKNPKKAKKQRVWDGRINLLRGRFFPPGLLDRVVLYCEYNNIKYKTTDERDYTLGEKIEITLEHKPYKHQVEALAEVLEHKQGTLAIATSGGKTELAMMLTSKVGLPTIFLVHKKGLLHQTRKRFQAAFKQPIGIIGDSVFEVEDITIATIQTITGHIKNKKAAYLKKFKVMICDEVHHLEATTWVNVCKALKNAAYRVGLSGTVKLTGKGRLLHAYTGPILYDVDLSYLREHDIIAPFKVHMMKYDGIDLPPNVSYKNAYDLGIVDNDDRNELICKISDYYIKKDMSVLILYRRIRHGENISKILTEQYNIDHRVLWGESDEDREQAKADVDNGTLKCVVASTIFDEGENVPGFQCLILAGGEKGGKHGRTLRQRIGRVVRKAKGKDRAVVIDFYDEINSHLKGHSKKRIKIYIKEDIQYKFKRLKKVEN